MPTSTRQVDGLTIRYTETDAADEPVILLTSPWPESLLAFRRVWAALATRARLVAIDLPGFGHSQGRTDLFRPDAMAEFLHRLIGEFGLGSPHMVAPDVGTSAALFLAARHPGAVKSLVVGSGASAWPLEVAGLLADIIAAPDIEAFKTMDIRANIGAAVEPVAPHAQEPVVWEDYVTSYENGRFAESTRYVRSYPTQLPPLRDLLPEVMVPVHIVEGQHDPLVPPSNGRYLADRLPDSRLTILDTGHFPWELDPGQYSAIIAETVARAETVRLRIPPPAAGGKPGTSSAISRGAAADPRRTVHMTQVTHDTAPTQYVEAGGIRFAYRRFGAAERTPLVFFQHFMGTLDDHDPALSDAFAIDREVILFDNTGVASSSGLVPDTIEAMARDAITFIEALGLTTVDLVGHSMGGLVVQEVALARPDLVRRLVLVGTGPRGGEGIGASPAWVSELFTRKYERQEDMWLPILFTPTEASQAAGRAYVERIVTRADRDKPFSDQSVTAQLTAIHAYGAAKDPSYARLKGLELPVLVVNGSNDIVILTINSYILQQFLPNAELILYPDANHGSHFQYPELFVRHARIFLDGQ